MNGRSVQALSTVMIRCTARLRLAQLGYLLVFVAAWADWYRAHPAALAGPVVVLAWGVLFVVHLRRRPCRAMAVADVAVAALVALATDWLTPDPSRGDPASFAFVGLLTAVVVAAFALPARGFAVATAVLAGGQLAGATDHRPQVFAATAILLVVGALLHHAAGRLRRVAVDADLQHRDVTVRRRRQLVAEGREQDSREQERLLHDTILNTLTGLGMSEDQPAGDLRRQCADSVRAVEEHLASRSGVGPTLADRIDQAVGSARRAGLRVVLDADAPQDGPEPTDEWVPDEVGAAVAAAMGEALRNVRAHAGTDDARVLAQVGPGRLEVSIVDRGRGFRLAELAADSRRLGLRHSVFARMAAVGGSADLWSDPGQGTRITLRWELPQPVAAETTCADRLEEQFAAAARRAFALAVVVGWLAALIPVVVHRDETRSMPAGVAIWLATAVVIGLTARIVARRPLGRRESAAVLLTAVASAVAGAVNTAEPPGELVVSWCTTMINPLLVALAVLSRPQRERYAAAGFATVAMVGIVVGLGCRDDPLVLARLAAAVYAQWIMQVLVTMFGPVLRASAQERARADDLEADLTSRRVLDRTVRRDRRRRLDELDARFLPLLRDIAAGRSDPGRPEVRALCTARARALRRDLVGAGLAALRDLAGPIEQAEARGIAVTVQMDGDLSGLPEPVQREFFARISAVLAAVRQGPVVLTGYLGAAQASLYLTYPARRTPSSTVPPAPAPAPAAAARTVPDVRPAPGAAEQATVDVRVVGRFEGRRAGVPAAPGRPVLAGPTLAEFGRAGEFGPGGSGLVRAGGTIGEGVACIEVHWSAPAAAGPAASPAGPSPAGPDDQATAVCEQPGSSGGSGPGEGLDGYGGAGGSGGSGGLGGSGEETVSAPSRGRTAGWRRRAPRGARRERGRSANGGPAGPPDRALPHGVPRTPAPPP